ncbi:MAG TPA: hypothetical protein VK476_05380, partial [Flavobacterium sp.]|nr:hypothetical protein [Flavobacterium sp.]
MKKILWFYLSLVNFVSFGQTYVLDPSFGNGGTIVSNSNIYPVKCIWAESSYYLLGSQNLTRISDSGQVMTSFGVNGSVAFNSTVSNEVISLTGTVYHDGFIYVYGNLINNNTNASDMMIGKLYPNGSFDTTFGNNGVVRIDFRPKDAFKNFVFESDGGLFCSSNISETNSTNSRMAYFKL